MTQPPTDGNERLGDRYEIGGMLGRGGMADVRVGRDLRLGRTVAVKRLRTDLASDTTFQARFRREAQSAAKLNHPAIVAVYDTGDELDRDGTQVPYIVMEYVEGRTLRDILREERKILPERALEITADILSALDYSHRQGIVHRDIKPGNVMLTPSGQVKVMDFGIARAIADASSAMTQTAAVVGTAQYLSPEQARGEQVDARSDIYSTGCLLYELLTGRPPFVGDSPVSVAYQHVREEADRPSAHNPELDPDIDAILAKALAKRTDERYQSAAQMRADIERHLAGHQVAAPAVLAGAAATTVQPAVPAGDTGLFGAASDEPEPEPKSHKALWAVLLVLAVAAVVAALVFILDPFASDEPEGPPQVSVPDVVTMTEQRATRQLEAADLVVETETRTSDDIAEGRVISQDPPAGDFVDEGSVVTLVVSAGPETVEIPPDLVGMKLREVRSILEDELGLATRVDRVDDDAPRNQVLAVDPSSGNEVTLDTEVTITVSLGPIVVPDVTGLSEEEAIDLLEEAGFRYQVETENSEDVPEGEVIRQLPEADSQGGTDDVVIFWVSLGPEETEETPPTDDPTDEPTDEPTDDPTDEPSAEEPPEGE
jgi:beta-lactam-binding protein with PASTA domain/tRNA A-37 threonylcarbamoyl transferase component Bud32